MNLSITLKKATFVASLLMLFGIVPLHAQTMKPYSFTFNSWAGHALLLIIMLVLVIAVTLILSSQVKAIRDMYRKKKHSNPNSMKKLVEGMNSHQLDVAIKSRKGNTLKSTVLILMSIISIGSFTLLPQQTFAQTNNGSLFSNGGIIITIVLLLIPILLALILIVVKVLNSFNKAQNKVNNDTAENLADFIKGMPDEEIEALQKRKEALDYHLTKNELSGSQAVEDKKGLLNIIGEPGLPAVSLKKKAQPRPNIDPQLSRLVIWFLGCATFWLLFGTSIGEYLGIKFVAPDADHVSWLSFGRLRPVHTNSVFWGWASLGMLGLGYYIIPRVSNTKLYSLKWGWITLWSVNISVILGTLCLMAGINNGGGEYREYIWPVMLLFAIGLILTLINFLKTIARRTTKEIYVSNWYIVSAIIFTIVIALVAYLPFWQDGLGETIAQGYYMHQGVGMWFMLYMLGVVYYFLPQQLNKPIYSYSLGILAFWTQILFYTLIGTHHFIFSPIPWWLQTVAIVGSAGMIIPVTAGTTNFLMTFKGAWYKVKGSYTLPFFLVGTIFYFTGSFQGTAEAFRSANLIWHFTDFTVAHSHLTMYGIICFFLWASIYAVIPRLTGKEAPHATIGVHFWLALIGMLFYTVPLMWGSTLKGLMWMQGKPFIDGVVMMAPYWLWRAVGGSLMWLSHIFFAYNMYRMLSKRNIVDVREKAIEKLDSSSSVNPIA